VRELGRRGLGFDICFIAICLDAYPDDTVEFERNDEGRASGESGIVTPDSFADIELL
jgi:hypothetical protein